MRVHMDCPGCENKVKSALQKLKGIPYMYKNIFCNHKLYVTITNVANDAKKEKCHKSCTQILDQLINYSFHGSNLVIFLPFYVWFC